MANLLAEHQRRLAGTQILLYPAALNVFRQQLGIEPRGFQRYRRLSRQRLHHVGMLGGEDVGHQAVFQIQHADQPRLLKHRHAHHRRAGSDQIRVLTEGAEAARTASANRLAGANHG